MEISASVKDVTSKDLSSSDVLKISGTFQIGSAQIENTLLVITDKTDTRKIRIGDFGTAKNAKINSTTISTWLANANINLNNLNSYSLKNELPNTGKAREISSTSDDGGEGRIAGDPGYTPTLIKKALTAKTSDCRLAVPIRSGISMSILEQQKHGFTKKARLFWHSPATAMTR